MSLSSVSLTLLLAFGVAMDAFAVSITNGLCYAGREPTKKVAWSSAVTFGLFQGIMPLLGFLAGSMFREIAESFDHWIALLLLGFIGANMIVGAVKEMRNPEKCPCPPFTTKELLLQGVATSIDAFAVGIGLAMDNSNIAVIAPTVAATTFLFSFVGVYLGEKFGNIIGDKAQIVGGVILIGIGVQIFLSHTM